MKKARQHLTVTLYVERNDVQDIEVEVDLSFCPADPSCGVGASYEYDGHRWTDGVDRGELDDDEVRAAEESVHDGNGGLDDHDAAYDAWKDSLLDR